MFCVIYSFEVKDGFNAQFEYAWSELTKLIYKYEGSLGSRLHKKSAQSYVAYAQWPDKSTWENFGDHLPENAKSLSAQMLEACAEREIVFELDMLDDLLKSTPSNSPQF